jgi:asparagine synthase (glutamine-hydrolysing)
LRSPRGIGTQLSAGLDSSTVTALAAGILLPRGRRLTAFTAVPRPEYRGKGLPGRLPDEGPGAAEVAAMYANVDHVPIDSARYDLLTEIQRWTDAMDEPAQNCVNMLWIAAIMAAARDRGIGVMLHGLTGNATFSADGWEAMTPYFRTGRWVKLYKLARNLRRRGELSFKASALLATEGLLPPRLKHKISPTAHTLNLEYSPAHPDLVAEHRLAEKEFRKIYGILPDIRTQRAEFFERFDPAPLNSATRARAGLDKRDPLADKRVFEFCYSIPIEQYAVGAQSRSLARRAMRGRLPQSTLQRGVRGQQGADWYLTLAESLGSFARELPLIQQSPLARRYLDLPRLQRLIETWPESGHETHTVSDSWNYALTRGISLGYMLRSHDEAVPNSDKSPKSVAIEPKKQIPTG